jgi:hypothetical protein
MPAVEEQAAKTPESRPALPALRYGIAAVLAGFVGQALLTSSLAGSLALTPMHYVIMGFGVLLILGMRNPPELVLWPAALFVAALYLAPTVARLAYQGNGEPLSVREAVGNSSFLGAPKSLEYRAFFVTAFCLFALGVAFAFLHRLLSSRRIYPRIAALVPSRGPAVLRSWHRSFVDGMGRPPALDAPASGGGLFVTVLVLLFALVAAPAIKQTYDGLPHTVYGHNWDMLNHNTWEYMAARGWIPFRDFWYPYGAFWDQWVWTRQPWNQAGAFFQIVAVMTVFVISVYLLTGRDKLWTALIFGAVVILREVGVLAGTERYFLCIDAVFFYLAIQRLEPLRWFHYAACGVLWGWIFIYEPAQVVYAGIPVALQSLLYLVRDQNRQQRWARIRGLASMGAALIAVVGVYVILLAARGQLKGFLDFFGEMSAMLVYASWHLDGFLDWYRLRLDSYESLAYLTPHLLVALGAFWNLCRRKGPVAIAGDITFCLGLMGLVAVQKQMARPHMATQLIGIYVVWVMLLLRQWSGHWNRSQRYAAAVFLGIFLSLFFERGFLTQVVQKAATGPVRMVEGVKVLSRDPAEIEGRIAASFSPYAFAKHPRCGPLRAYLDERNSRGQLPQIYVLGDDSCLYIIARQKPPPYITHYNASPIGAQREVVAWLTKTKPGLVVWNTAKSEFDGVPHLVRVPLIFETVIRTYEPAEEVEAYRILRPRTPGKPIDWGWWKRNLGGELKLGSVPSLSNLKDLKDCAGPEQPGCHEFLEIELPPTSQPRPWTVAARAAGETFRISFVQRPLVARHHIYLDRMWFWTTAKSEGLKPEIDPTQAPGMSLRRIYKMADSSVLY